MRLFRVLTAPVGLVIRGVSKTVRHHQEEKKYQSWKKEQESKGLSSSKHDYEKAMRKIQIRKIKEEIKKNKGALLMGGIIVLAEKVRKIRY